MLTGHSAFGRSVVRGLRRVPEPAAKTKPATSGFIYSKIEMVVVVAGAAVVVVGGFVVVVVGRAVVVVGLAVVVVVASVVVVVDSVVVVMTAVVVDVSSVVALELLNSK